MIDFDLIEQDLAELLDRHDTARTRTAWTYAELIGELQLRRFDQLERSLGDGPHRLGDIRRAWATDAGPVATEHAKALETAYLGEANLPWYTENLHRELGDGHPLLRDFFHRWVAEEDQHSRAFEIYLLHDRAADATDMLEAKQRMLVAGRAAPATDPFEIIVYTSIQELSTRVFYANLQHAVRERDPLLGRLLEKVQADESLHFAFYRGAVERCLQTDPSLVDVVYRTIRDYREPITVLPDYDERKLQIWEAGISSQPAFHYNVIEPLLRYWKLDYPSIHRPNEDRPRSMHDPISVAR
jgi:acyl-[acyl-carrier-protein] desaturase